MVVQLVGRSLPASRLLAVAAAIVLSGCTLVRTWDDLLGDAGATSASSTGSSGTGGSAGSTSSVGGAGGFGAAGGAGGGGSGPLGGAIRWVASCASTTSDLSNALDFDQLGDAFTIEFWYQPDELEGSYFLKKGGSSSSYRGWNVHMSDAADRGAGLYFDAHDGTSGEQAGIASVFYKDHPVHVVVTREGKMVRLWVLDAYALQLAHSQVGGASDIPESWADNNEPLSMAGTSTHGTLGCREPFLTGILDEVRVWKRARTQVEFDADYDKQLPCDTADLVAYWPLDEMPGEHVVHDVHACDPESNLHLGIKDETTSPADYQWIASPFGVSR